MLYTKLPPTTGSKSGEFTGILHAQHHTGFTTEALPKNGFWPYPGR